MAIIENRSTTEGDVLIIRTEEPIVGLVSLLGFTDQTVGETPQDYFRKEFRYSVNGGLTYTPWVELTSANIMSANVSKKDNFIIEYRYIRVGNVGELAFENILLNGQFEELNYPIYDRLPFSDFFPIKDPNVFGWALNVLEKLYQKGILPDYVERLETGAVDEDEDFIAFWNSITEFFAILVYFSRQFQNLHTNTTLLRLFVETRGLFTCDTQDLEQLNFLASNLYDEYRKRGTRQINLPKSGDVPVDGELLRLLCWEAKDEFIFALTKRGEMGWCLGNSSPMYTGADEIVNINKSYEFTREVLDLTKYPLINSNDITLEQKNGISMMKLTTSGADAGIGNSTETDKLIPIDSGLDYMLMFRVIAEDLTADLDFGVVVFNKDRQIIGIQSIVDGSISNMFFENQGVNQADVEYWVRGIIFNSGKALNSSDSLPIGFGNNLRFVEGAEYILPVIKCSNSTKFINSIDVRPLALPISRGVLTPKNFTFGYFENNGSLNDDDAKLEINSKLISYNQFIKIKWL